MPHPLAAMLLLFTRFDPSEILGHATRARLFGHVERQPGATVGEIRAALGVDYKTLVHHARALERAGHLVIVKDGRARRCYLARAPASSQGDVLADACPPSRCDP